MRDRITHRFLFNDRLQQGAIFFSEQFGIIEQVVLKFVMEYHSCSRNRSGQTTAPSLIGASLENILRKPAVQHPVFFTKIEKLTQPFGERMHL